VVRQAVDVGPLLDALARRYDRAWLESDPLRWPRRYADARDREVVAVVAALLAYGRVASIHRSIEAVLGALPASPSAGLSPARRPALRSALRGFRHRFTSGEDLAWVLESVGAAWDARGSLGAVVSGGATGEEPLRTGLAAWRRLASATPASDDPARVRARRFLLPDPEGGGACKRTLLLARWCVRDDDGLDLGLWRGAGRLEPKHLLLPLDTHVHRIARQIGLTRRRAADWATAREVTTRLRAFDPDDPVRFDFALARPGIVGLCRHRHVPSVCGPCDLRAACAFGRPPAGRGRRRAPAPTAAP
jgi:uncharacterized protein (TIGR02757 family)